jgi:hypothetical protein
MIPTKPLIYEGTSSALDDYLGKSTPAKQLTAVIQETPPSGVEGNWGLFNKNNAQHRRIQANLRTAKIVTDKGYADMLGWFNRFLKKPRSPVKKPLKSMTPKEVSKIIVALDGIAV